MRPSIVERAFQLAASGQYKSVTELRRQLSAEDYPDARPHLDGKTMRSQLADVMFRHVNSR